MEGFGEPDPAPTHSSSSTWAAAPEPDDKNRAFESGYGFDQRLVHEATQLHAAAQRFRAGSQSAGTDEQPLLATATNADPDFVTGLPLSVFGEHGHYKGHVSPTTRLPEGKGVFRSAAGVAYTGEWLDGLPGGAGTQFDAEGTERAGTWIGGALTSTDHVRSLEERFNAGLPERTKYLEEAGYDMKIPTASGYLLGIPGYLTTFVVCIVALVRFDAENSSPLVYPVAAALLLQVAVWVWLPLHWWFVTVPNAALRTNVANAQYLLIPLSYLWMGGILNAPLWDDFVTGHETWFFACCTCQQAWLFLVAALITVYVNLPGSVKERNQKAKEAFESGMWAGYVDPMARTTRPIAIDMFLIVVGGGGVACGANLISTTTQEDNTFYTLNYYAVATAAGCFVGGLALSTMRLHPYFSHASPGHLSRRDQYGMLAFLPSQLAATAFCIAQTVYWCKYGRQLKQLEGTAVITLGIALWWTIIFCATGVMALLDGRSRASLYIQEDEAIYKDVWSALSAQHGADIAELGCTCDGLKVPSTSPKQPGSARGFANFVSLFRLARLLDPLVQAKGSEWATSASTNSADAPAKHSAAPLKTHERAIQKVWRTYGGRVNSLLDLSRTCVVCRSIAQVNSVLQAIAQDPDVALLRCKNRLHPKYNGKATAGYRDLSLNLAFTSPEAARLGLDGVVCEVQLLVQAFYEVKTDEGHANYRKFRDLRVA